MKNNLNLKILLLSVIFTLLSVNSQAQVGVETIDPKLDLDVNGAISLREGTALILTNNAYNTNISLGASPYSFYSITGPSNLFYVSSIIPLTNADGQIVTLQNTTDAIMAISHEYASTAAENRILISGENDLILRGKNSSVTLQYSTAQSRWVVINKLNNVQTWYRNDVFLLDSLKNDVITTGTAITQNTGILSVSIINNSSPPIPQSELDNIAIEYIEVQNGEINVRIYNKNPDTAPGNNRWSYVVCSLAITYN